LNAVGCLDSIGELNNVAKKVLSFIAVIVIFIVSCSGGGPQFPFDTGYQDSADLAREFEEGRREAEEFDKMRKDDPCLDDKLSGVPPEEQRCGNWQDMEPEPPQKDNFAGEENTGNNGCSNGCTTHKSGCDIKGNISFNSGDKIYHVPGQNFYNETEINPNKGERWFCTEAEARANGWRKAMN
jgi:hypothetical protein